MSPLALLLPLLLLATPASSKAPSTKRRAGPVGALPEYGDESSGEVTEQYDALLSRALLSRVAGLEAELAASKEGFSQQHVKLLHYIAELEDQLAGVDAGGHHKLKGVPGPGAVEQGRRLAGVGSNSTSTATNGSSNTSASASSNGSNVSAVLVTNLLPIDLLFVGDPTYSSYTASYKDGLSRAGKDALLSGGAYKDGLALDIGRWAMRLAGFKPVYTHVPPTTGVDGDQYNASVESANDVCRKVIDTGTPSYSTTCGNDEGGAGTALDPHTNPPVLYCKLKTSTWQSHYPAEYWDLVDNPHTHSWKPPHGHANHGRCEINNTKMDVICCGQRTDNPNGWSPTGYRCKSRGVVGGKDLRCCGILANPDAGGDPLPPLTTKWRVGIAAVSSEGVSQTGPGGERGSKRGSERGSEEEDTDLCLSGALQVRSGEGGGVCCRAPQ